jgi:nicotinate-nucleotide adenylyltransferase
MPRIALFGTSADPPHRGHAAILTWLAQHFDYVAVWTAENPFKSCQTPLDNRFDMLQLMLDELQLPPERIGLRRDLSHRWSIVSIERAQACWPEAQLVLVIGSDLINQLPSWHRAKDILAAVEVLIVPRPGYPIMAESLANLSRHTQVEIASTAELVDVASSSCRQVDGRNHLTPAVRHYISQHHLYQPSPQPLPRDF